MIATSDSDAKITFASYDTWGNRRNADDWTPLTKSEMSDLAKAMPTDRGFTGHEQLDHLQLVHMNGRIYDPVIGKMISPDPGIQSPDNLQSFNRYSYVWNNPLSLTDPSGFVTESTEKSKSAESDYENYAEPISPDAGTAGQDYTPGNAGSHPGFSQDNGYHNGNREPDEPDEDNGCYYITFEWNDLIQDWLPVGVIVEERYTAHGMSDLYVMGLGTGGEWLLYDDWKGALDDSPGVDGNESELGIGGADGKAIKFGARKTPSKSNKYPYFQQRPKTCGLATFRNIISKLGITHKKLGHS